MLKAERLKVEIEALQVELYTHQRLCKHKKATKNHRSNTLGYGPEETYYWTEFRCPTCLKRWDKDGLL